MNASSLPSSTRLLFDELLLRPDLRLRIGEHVIDVGALRLLTRPAHPRLTGKGMAVLIELVRHAGTTITREQLLDRVWADRVTTPDVLTQAIKELRRAFMDDAKPSRYIETIPRVGYRLLAPVSTIGDDVAIISEGARLTRAENDPETDTLADIDAEEIPAQASLQRGPTRPRFLLAAISLFLLVAALIAIAGIWLHRMSLTKPSAADWSAHDIRVVTSDPGVERRPSVSPDGTRVAYSQFDPISNFDRLFVRVIGQSQSALLTSKTKTHEEMPTWSPDGTQIAFERLQADRCTMFITSIVGGTEREVGDCRDFIVNYFDWTPDGKALITSDNIDGSTGSMTLIRWDLDSGAKVPFTYSRAHDDQDLEAHYSPDGKTIAFRRGLAPYSDIYMMSAAGGDVRQLTNLASRIRGLAWTADGAGVVFSSDHEGRSALYAVTLSAGQITPVNVGPAVYPAAARASDVIVYEIPRSSNRLAQISLGADKTSPQFLAKSTGNDSSPALSPNGDRIAFVSDRNGSQQIWLYDFSANTASVLTDFHDAVLISPSWSDDGRRILLTLRHVGSARLVEIDIATRQEHFITKADERILSGEYGPDPDSYLLILGKSQEHNEFTFVEHAGSAAEKRTALAHGVEHTQVDKSARRAYYTKNAHGGLYARDLNGADEQLVTETIVPSLLDGWRVVDGRVWYVSKVDWIPTDIIEFDPATAKTRTIGHLDAEMRDVGFSVAQSRDRIFIVPLGLEDTDVGSFRFSRAAQP